MDENHTDPQTWARWRALLESVAQSPRDLYASLHPDGWTGLLEERPPVAGSFVLFKGSFNPIHNGHTALFAAALRKHAPAPGAFALSLQTSKRRLSLEDILIRSRLIHAAGYSVVVSASGRFSHDAAFFRQLSSGVRLVFPVGTDVLLRLLAYYSPREFDKLFTGCTFEYCARPGIVPHRPERFGDYPQVRCLAEEALSSISSSQVRELCALRMDDEVRTRMPAGAAELYLPAARESNRPVRTAPGGMAHSGRGLEILRAEGVHLYLSDGRRVLDAAGGAGVVNVGYGRGEVVEALARAASSISYAVPGFSTPHRLALVEHLRAHWLPEGFSRVHLMSSGSEAIEAAIMLARKYQVASGRLHRWKIVGRDVSYHGATLGSLAIGGHDLRRSGLGDLLPAQPHAAACYCLRCPFGKRYPDCRVECGRSLETLIEREGPETIAAFVLEPIVGASGGALVPPNEYWETVHQICRRHDILVIADEVTTGWGRTGRRFAFEHWAPPPDIVVAGKGMTGGYAPLAAVFLSEAVGERLESAAMAPVSHTYDGHSPACAAAEAVLRIIRDEGLVESVMRLGPSLGRSLIERLGDHPQVAQVRGLGYLWAVEVVRDRDTLERFPRHANVTKAIVRAGLDRGVFFYPGGTGAERDIVVLSPPFVLGLTEMQEMAAVLGDAIDSVVPSL